MKCHLCENNGISGAYVLDNVFFVLCGKCQEDSDDDIKSKIKEKRDNVRSNKM